MAFTGWSDLMTDLSIDRFMALVFAIIAFPLFTLLTIFLYKNQHLIHYEKRGKKLIWGTHLLSMTGFYYMNLLTLFNLFGVTHDSMWPLCMLILCAGLEVFGAGKYLYQFVNIKRQQDLHHWKQHLNPMYTKQNKEFIMKHVNIFGNNKRITLICFGIVFLALIIYGSGFIFLPDGSYKTYTIIVGMSVYFVVGVFNLYVTRFGKLFAFVDIWGIAAQQKISAIKSIVVITFLLVIIWIDIEYYVILTLSNTICSSLLILFTISNIITPYKYYKTSEKYQRLISVTTSAEPKSVFNTINNDAGYMAFMNHLYQEYCSENLLFLTIMFQFQDFLRDNQIINKNMSLFDEQYTLPECVPGSVFFKQEQNVSIEEKVGQSFVAIYDKFIAKYKAEFQINIPHTTTMELMKHYNKVKANGNKIDKNDVESIWNTLKKASHSVYSLLIASHNRFHFSASYSSL